MLASSSFIGLAQQVRCDLKLLVCVEVDAPEYRYFQIRKCMLVFNHIQLFLICPGSCLQVWDFFYSFNPPFIDIKTQMLWLYQVQEEDTADNVVSDGSDYGAVCVVLTKTKIGLSIEKFLSFRLKHHVLSLRHPTRRACLSYIALHLIVGGVNCIVGGVNRIVGGVNRIVRSLASHEQPVQWVDPITLWSHAQYE